MYARILVPLDGSQAAEKALPHAAALGLCFNAQILLTRVVEPLVVPPIPSFTTPVFTVSEHPGDAEAAQRYLDEQAQALIQAGLTVETVLRHGDAADELLDAITEKHADLVVMTACGHGGIARLIGGSTAETVLARIPVPALVIPPPRHVHK